MSAHSPDTLERHPETPGRVALVSDPHANLPAFEAVIADIDGVGVDAIWCLGDLVGYGAHPDECVALARERCDVCLVGNHDLVVLGRLDIAHFSHNAAIAASWTRRRLGNDAREYLDTLAAEDLSHPIGLYHASPRDPIWEYVLSALLADSCLDAMDARVGAIGHSHVALSFRRAEGERAEGELAPHGMERDLSSGEWLINPGSVGQPRDGDPRAAWLLLDLKGWTATWRRVEYPIDEAAEAIRMASLPDALAERLYYGQ